MHHCVSCVLLSGASQSCIPTCCCESVWDGGGLVSALHRGSTATSEQNHQLCLSEVFIYLHVHVTGSGRGGVNKGSVLWTGYGLFRRSSIPDVEVPSCWAKETNDGLMFTWRLQCGCLSGFRECLLLEEVCLLWLSCWLHLPLAGAFCLKVLNTEINSYIHSYSDGSDCHASHQPAHQEQFGVWYLAQGHIQTRGICSSCVIIYPVLGT